MSEYYSISSKIRQYMSGLLLIAIAGFIIAMIENLVTSIPDVSISTGSVTLDISVMVFESTESGLWYGNVYYSYYDLQIPPPPSGYKYVIVFKVELHPQYGFEIFRNIGIWDGQEWIVFWDTELDECCRYRVGGDDYYFIEWDREIVDMDIYSYYISYSGRVYVYTVPATMSIPFPLDQPAQSQSGNATSISLKTFLKFISWIASIFIVITALHKFDIYV